MPTYQDRINQYLVNLQRPEPRHGSNSIGADVRYRLAKGWFGLNYPEATPEQYQSFCTKAAKKLGL